MGGIFGSGGDAEAKAPDERPPFRVGEEDRIAFHLAEYAALKAEIAALVEQTRAHLTYAIATSGGIIAWLLTHTERITVPEARFIPFVVSALFGSLSCAAYLRSAEKSAYVRRLEESLAAAGLGWEHEPRRRPGLIMAMHLAMWGAVNLAGLYAAFCIPQLRP